ncbi:hypothetical protein WJX84_008601 [Apatococcus fuscideae]|uniref:HD/PDEase domain-containing protein n=1 Tax=Apatococcus fuscideae TaxID=2026836 RepID=A0AAW1TG07_9CHLO
MGCLGRQALFQQTNSHQSQSLLSFAPLAQLLRRSRNRSKCSAAALAEGLGPAALSLTAQSLAGPGLASHQWVWGVRSIWMFSSPLTYALLGLCSLPLAALGFGTAKVAWESWESESSRSLPVVNQEICTLHGVDVSSSRFLTRPKLVETTDFAARAHHGQTRLTGDPYIMHCIETALIVEQLICNTYQAAPYPDDRIEEALQVALLHDVTDDTAMNVADVEEAFGADVAEMVRKVSQLSSLNQLLRRRKRQEARIFLEQEEDEQLRDLVMSMVGNPLVILIKLADRLHNMRTVYALKPNKARAVAAETRQLWCSLAERLGILPLKAELEDLCMAVLDPHIYKHVYNEVSNLWGPQQDGRAALNELSEADSRSSQEAALQERRASSAAAGPSSSTGQSRSSQHALNDAMMEFLRTKGPSRKGRTLRMTITPAMNAIWAARRFTAGASSGGSQASPQFASAFTSSYDDGGMPSSSSNSNSIPSNSRTGRTLHTRREWEEMKRTRQVVKDMIEAQATIDSETEKQLPWLSSEQRQVCPASFLHIGGEDYTSLAMSLVNSTQIAAATVLLKSWVSS